MRSSAYIRRWSILTPLHLTRADWSSRDVKSVGRLLVAERRIPNHKVGFVGRVS
jgi:hypothetical protein